MSCTETVAVTIPSTLLDAILNLNHLDSDNEEQIVIAIEDDVLITEPEPVVEDTDSDEEKDFGVTIEIADIFKDYPVRPRRKASKGPFKRILNIIKKHLHPVDPQHVPFSSVVDVDALDRYRDLPVKFRTVRDIDGRAAYCRAHQDARV